MKFFYLLQEFSDFLSVIGYLFLLKYILFLKMENILTHKESESPQSDMKKLLEKYQGILKGKWRREKASR